MLSADQRNMKASKYIVLAVVLVCVGFIVCRGGLSLRWRVIHDSPLMLYTAFLTEKYGAVPHKDFFDMNMPGTYFINLLPVKAAGQSDLAFRVFDLCYPAACRVH